MNVDVVHFNPLRRPAGRLGRFRRKRPLNNFGDLLGPLLVERIVQAEELPPARQGRRLLTIGSIMKLSVPGDTVWGSGVNGKSLGTGGAPDLDVRAVRGPRTRSVLTDRGTRVPEVFGDPALLWPTYWPRESYLGSHGVDIDISVVPNFHDRPLFKDGDHNYVDPLDAPHDVISQIARSNFVCGSSLHGIVLAEAFGIPARLIKPGREPDFKYDDYYRGTGRRSHMAAASVAQAVAMGGEDPPEFDRDALLAAFPRDLWG